VGRDAHQDPLFSGTRVQFEYADRLARTCTSRSRVRVTARPSPHIGVLGWGRRRCVRFRAHAAVGFATACRICWGGGRVGDDARAHLAVAKRLEAVHIGCVLRAYRSVGHGMDRTTRRPAVTDVDGRDRAGSRSIQHDIGLRDRRGFLWPVRRGGAAPTGVTRHDCERLGAVSGRR
jgi:hypothetical protein